MFGQALLGEPTRSIQQAGIFTFKITTVDMGAPYASVPIYLANNQLIRSPVFIDWGDGQQTYIMPSSNKSDSIHEYATAGEYTINCYCENWPMVYLWGSNKSDEYPDPTNIRGIFSLTGAQILTPFPSVAGTVIDGVLVKGCFDKFFNASTPPNLGVKSFPAGLFSLNKETLISARQLFSPNYNYYIPKNCIKGCKKLTDLYEFAPNNYQKQSIDGLLAGCTSLKNLNRAFCALTGTVRIVSRNVEDATDFCTEDSENVKIEVPKGSKTEKSFNAFYASLSDRGKTNISITSY